jgi:glycosyltransferase involved in cell wall biosynthesis
MDITHVIYPFDPELDYQEHYLPVEQANLNNEVTIVTGTRVPKSNGDPVIHEPGWDEYDGVDIYRLPTTFSFDSIGMGVLRNLSAILKDLDPDIIHAHNILSITCIEVVLSELRSDTDVFVDVHIDNDNLSVDKPWKRLLYAGFRLAALPIISYRVDGILPVNPFAEQFVNDFGISQAKTELLPLGVDTNHFHPNLDGTEVRRRLGIETEEPVLITAGNFNETKDLDVLIEAFAQHNQEASLILLGEGPTDYMDKIHSLVQNYELVDSVYFHDRVPHEELPHFFAASDIGIWPGKLGISIVEAIGCGLPIVVCDSPATEFLTANENGFVFSRGKREELASQIQKYLSKPSVREQHAKNAIEYAQKELAWERIAEKSIKIYKEL